MLEAELWTVNGGIFVMGVGKIGPRGQGGSKVDKFVPLLRFLDLARKKARFFSC